MSPGRALLRVSGGGGAVAPGHVTAAAGAGVSWRAAAARSAGTAPRSCGVLAATWHRYTRHTISTLGHVLNIYTISTQHLTYHTGHMDGQTIYSLAQQILTICTLFTEYLLTFSSLSTNYLLTTY